MTRPRSNAALSRQAAPGVSLGRSAGRLAALLVTAGLLACRRDAPASLLASMAGPDERAALMRQIAQLREVEPCLADAGAEAGVRLVSSELAGEAATVSFACTRLPLHGTVTFFRVAEVWKVSTKDIQAAAR